MRYEKSVFTVGKPVAWYLGVSDYELSNKLGTAISFNHHTSLIADEELKKKLKSYTDHSLIPEEYKTGFDYYKKYEEISEEKIFPVASKQSKSLQADPKVADLLQNIFSPDFSPGLADDERLKGLPEALFVMVESDPLKDEGLIYAQRLRNNGVKVDINFYESAYHGISARVEEKYGYQVARDMLQDMISWMDKRLNQE